MIKICLQWVVALQLTGAGFAFANVQAPSTCNLANNCAIFTASGTNSAGRAIAAAAEFWVSASSLYVELINTATSDVLVPVDVLTGLYFTLKDTSGNLLTLTRVSATLGQAGDTANYNSATSTVAYTATQPAGGIVGGENAYKTGISWHGASSGISNAGLGIFGPGDRFSGPNLAGPASPDGVQYGILSAGDNSATGNGGITGSGGLVKNSVQYKFTLPANPANFNIAAPGVLTNVGFQYGTAVTETSLRVPIPGTASLLLLGFGLLCFRRRLNNCSSSSDLIIR